MTTTKLYKIADWCLFTAWVFGLIALVAVNGHAQNPRVGRDPKFINSKNFKYQAYKEPLQCEVPYKYGFSFLWHTAGDNLQYAAAEVADPRVNLVKLDVINETCYSRGDCGKYEYLAGFKPRQFWKLVSKRDARARKVVEDANRSAAEWLIPRLRPDQQCYVSYFLETHGTRAQLQIVHEWASPFWGGRCGAVWNPVGPKPGLPPEGFVASEGHGPTPVFADNRCFANLDGSLAPDGDHLAYFNEYKDCIMVFGWGPNDNCIFSTQTGRIDPRARDCHETKDYTAIGKAMCQSQMQQPPPPWSEEDLASLNGCHAVHESLDKPGGFILKQSHVVGSPNHKGTVLFPAKYGKFKRVAIWKGGKKYLTVEYAPGEGFADQQAGNKRRPIYRFDKNLVKLPYNIVFRGTTEKGKVQCWKVSNPRVRND